MSKKKITFIVPALPEVRVTKENRLEHRKLFTLPYLGILLLAAVTPEDYEVSILNEHIDPLDYDAVDGRIVGITVMTPMAPRSYAIARELEKRGKTVVLGGMHPTYQSEEASRHADAVVCGEAEETWPELLKDYESGRLKKIYLKKEPSDLAKLPLPRRDLVDHLDNPIDVIQVTRGCPYRCVFCSIHHFHDNTFRTRPIKHVIEELSTLKGRLVAFVDDNLAGKHDWAKTLFEAMIPLKKKWVSMASLSVVHDDELLQLARRSGCLGFFVGLESLNDRNLERSRKRVNRALVRDYGKAISKMHSYGLGISAGTVYGFDEDGPGVFSDTLDFARDVQLNMLQVSPLTPFPGTELFQQFGREGRALDSDWSKYNFYDVVFDPKNMTRQELLEGMNWVRAGFYSWPSIFRRVLLNAPRLGLFSTAFNVYLNYSYRANQRRGFRYPP